MSAGRPLKYGAVERRWWSALLDRVATPGGALTLLVLHVVAQGLLRIVFGTGLELDDGEAAALMQNTLAAAYQVRNPPLYEWLLWGMQQATGVGLLAHVVLRHLLILIAGLAALVAGRRLLGERAAGLMLLALFLTVWFPLNFLFWGTHTLLLTTALFGWCVALISWREKRSWSALAALALFATLGLLGKWSFPLVIVGSALALAIDRDDRKALHDWRLFLVPLVMAIAASPVFWAIYRHGGDVIGMSMANMAGDAKPWIIRALTAAWLLPVSYALFLLPLAPVVAACVWRAPGSAGHIGRDSALLLRVGAVLFVGSYVASVLAGAANLNEHYMYAIAFPVLMGLIGWAAGRSDPKVLSRVLAGGALIVVVVVLCIRAVTYTAGGFPERKQNKHLVPYPALAAELLAKGYGEAAFIADNNTLAGNLDTFLPTARALSPTTIGFLRPEVDLNARRCAAIRLLGFRPQGAPVLPLAATVPEMVPFEADALSRTIVSATWPPTLLGTRRVSDWVVSDLPPAVCARLYQPSPKH